MTEINLSQEVVSLDEAQDKSREEAKVESSYFFRYKEDGYQIEWSLRFGSL